MIDGYDKLVCTRFNLGAGGGGSEAPSRHDYESVFIAFVLGVCTDASTHGF